MRVLQINSVYNYGSTGRIAESIGKKVMERDGTSIVAYGRSANPGSLKTIKIGNKQDQAWHMLQTRIFDTHGFHSVGATNQLIRQIKVFSPDIIHLHNLHGYYLNVDVLFEFLKTYNKPVVWTLHDCWAYTGHCCYYERVGCDKWKTECSHCPLKFLYPESLVFDNSKTNYKRKKNIFNRVENIHLVTVSKWLEDEVTKSFLKNLPVRTIYNGINLEIFKPKTNTESALNRFASGKKIILGVANEWSDGKGYSLFHELSNIMPPEWQIILVGLSEKQMKNLPGNITGITRTKNQEELAELYNLADVFVTPSIAETFGMVVAEAMACGTPCVVNNSSALPELVTDEVGVVVNERTANAYLAAIEKVLNKEKSKYQNKCVTRAAELFEIDTQLDAYYALYEELTAK